MQRFEPDEQHAITHVRAVIDAVETLLATDAPSAEQREELEESIKDARAALAHYIRERMRGKTEAGALRPGDDFEPELAVDANDVTLLDVAHKAICLSGCVTLLGLGILVSRTGGCDEPPTPWERLGSALTVVGQVVEGIGNTTHRRATAGT